MTGHAPGEVSINCLIGKCGACLDHDCTHHCHPRSRTATLEIDPSFELELGGLAGETENVEGGAG